MLDVISEREDVPRERLSKAVDGGSLVLVKNARRDIDPLAIGEGVATKVNANIGFSPGELSVELELEKARVAVDAGADTLMDLSVGGDTSSTRKRILKETSVPLGTVPIYQAYAGRGLEFTLEDYLKEVESQCREGVDFMTIHAGVTLEGVKHAGERIIPVTSRGGCFLAAWMRKHNLENPLYTGYDDILEVLREYEVTVSLGDALRPGCLHDATDKAQLHELKVLGELTKRAWEAGVKVIVEGPGHVPLDQIQRNIELQKKACQGAPFYVLGPLVCDVGVGYDHITSAIGGAVAGMYGADFLCYVTPSEHLGLPDVKDVREGVIASKIAAHAADVVKLGRRGRDDEMSRARFNLDWDRMFELALDPDVKKRYKGDKKGGECSMCGEYCALKVYKGE
ncbi:MAG: phosphomethylpyrimidine synthase ThiC [Candidatus Altiarchaeales archaeon]|nr:phosphomethylpyrimidine synthase ThiC [Candidatus Altiarchaeales archaeon]MBD3416129.1 phosphomethylpyrimidine synthase ThiC [Candidatus Altiarchaeales archaeon]